MSLFSDVARTDNSPKTYRETDFEFLNRTAGNNWDIIRSKIEEWFTAVDPNGQKHLASALQGDASQFQGAFWELYLHQAFRSMGFAVTFEPRETGSDGQLLTPDFLLKRDGKRMYVDATVINDRTIEATRQKEREAISDMVNPQLKIAGFQLIATVREGYGNPTLPFKHLAQQLAQWIGSLDVAKEWQRQQDPSIFGAYYCYKGGGWIIDFYAMALAPPDQSTLVERPLSSWMVGMEMNDASLDAHAVRDAIKKKGKKYASLSAPLVVAVQIERLGTGEPDVRWALFGGLGLSNETLRTGTIKGGHGVDVDGVWATRKGPRYQNVAAVIAVERHLEPANAGDATPVVWLNPWAEESLAGVFPLSAWQVNAANHHLVLVSAGILGGAEDAQ